MKPETKFKIKVAAIFKKIPYFWFVKIQQVSINATPDFLACHRGRFYGIELKKDQYEDAKPLQLYELKKIGEAEGVGLVMHPDNYKEIIKKEFDFSA